jgi:integrase
MEEMLRDALKQNRPNLTEKSVKTYVSLLKKIMKELEFDKVSDLKQTDKVMKYLKDMPSNKRKTRLSALVVVTGEGDYSKKMGEDIKEFNDEVAKQEKSVGEKQAWLSKDDILDIWNRYKKRASTIYRKKDDMTMKDYQEIQNFVLLSLFVLIPPRRAMDYTEMKVRNVDKSKDNYIKGKQMVFNVYKTSKSKGQQTVEIPKELKAILSKWIRINPHEYLLYDARGGKLSSVKINQRFNKIMGKPNFSVNMFRHIFLTDKYADTMKEIKQMEEDMSAMGSSGKQATTYVKLDE